MQPPPLCTKHRNLSFVKAAVERVLIQLRQEFKGSLYQSMANTGPIQLAFTILIISCLILSVMANSDLCGRVFETQVGKSKKRKPVETITSFSFDLHSSDNHE